MVRFMSEAPGREGADDVEAERRDPGPKFFEIWRAPEVERAIDAAASELASIVETRGETSALDEALAASRRDRRPTLSSERASFAWAAAGLELATRVGDDARAQALLRRGTQALLRVGVGTHGSRLSALHQRLRHRVWRGRDPEVDDLDVSLRVLEHGVAQIDLRGAPLQLARARVLRLGGELDRADALLASMQRGDDDLLDVRWERACLAAMRDGALDAPFALLRTARGARTPERARSLYLWAHAVFSKRWMVEAGSVATLRRVSRPELDAGDARARSVAAELRVAASLERAYASRVPLGSRVDSVRRALDDAEEISDVGLSALAVGAAARWLARAKQVEPAEAARARYEALSLSLTRGRLADAFRLELGRGGSGTDVTAQLDEPAAVPASRLARELEVGRLGLALLGAASRGALAGTSAEDRIVEYARILAERSAALRGPIMKLGQMLSFYGVDIPQEARDLLGDLVDSGEPMPFGELRALVEAEHGRSLERTFETFDEHPLAAGSIGQIHGATLRGGARVIVKVRYPGIDDAIRRDFRSLSLLRPLLGSVLPTVDWPAALDELRTLALGECDFSREATHQVAFRRRLRDEDGVYIPRVEAELTTPSVLVAERFDGATFADFVRTATELERQRAADVLVRYVVRTTAIEREFNTDMHPGNLLFDGRRVCFVDFGSVRAWPEAESDGWRMILEGVLDDDAERVRLGLVRVGVADEGSDVDWRRAHVLLSRHLLRVVTLDAPTQISKETLRREIALMGPRAPTGVRSLRIPAAYAYGFRMYWGMFAVLADLGATLNFRRVCAGVLERFPRGDGPSPTRRHA